MRNPTINSSTVTIIQNGATQGTYPNAPLVMTGNINGYFQSVIQNTNNGNNASGNYIVENDLGNDLSFYGEFGINSSQYSQAGFSSQPSSSVYLASSDSDLFLWADENGALNGAQNGYIVMGTSNPTTGNIAMTISSAAVTINATALFAGVSIATVTAGGAGSLVTLSCPTGSYALSGGCNCSGAASPTSTIDMPYPTLTASGSMPTGWQCQEAGATGGACAVFVLCSKLRF